MHLVDDSGRGLDAEYLVEPDGDRLALVMESRSGTSRRRAPRNPDYNRALTVLRTCGHAQATADRLRQAGLEVLNDVVLNQVLVRAATDDQTLALVMSVQQDGTCWCGPTIWQHRPAMRISISGWATTSDDISKSADAIIAAAQRLDQE